MHPFEKAVIFCLNHIQRTGDGPAGEAAERHLAAIAEVSTARDQPRIDPAIAVPGAGAGNAAQGDTKPE